MLSRHFLRAKVLQTIYAAYTSETYHSGAAIKMFDHQIERLNELGSLQITALRYVIEEGKKVIEDGLHKHLPTQADLNPVYRIVDNQFINTLMDNFDYQQQCDKYNFPWAAYDDIFRKLYVKFRDSQKFQELMAEEEQNFDNAQRITLNLFKFIINDEAFRELFSERSLLWEDDFDQVAQYNYAMMKSMDEIIFDESTPLPMMIDQRDNKDMEALEFARTLVRETVTHMESNLELIKKFLYNWDLDRVATMDILIISMGIAELTACPSIPERVTIDECIELSKEFSSEKSKIFVNGILDKIVNELRVSGRISKSGRGLFVPGDDVITDGLDVYTAK